MSSLYINIPSFGSAFWKDPVPSAALLPSVGNMIGDVRLTIDTDIMYVWTGVAWAAATTGVSVSSVNGITGAVTIAAGIGATVTTLGSTITIGTSGGGNGITRTVLAISASQTLSSTASVDFVYFVSGITTVTMPTAVGNTNRYTIKNAGTNTVTIDTTSSQTIDGGLTAVLPVANTSLDLVSDGSNWRIC